MIEDPRQITLPQQGAAAIRLHIPVREMSAQFSSALQELSAVLAAQGIPPVGPVFAHHFRRPTDTFDFQVCVPVTKPVVATGRVEPVSLPELPVVQTTYHGDYGKLPHAWSDFIARVQTQGVALRGDFLEAYVVGPRESADAASWRTELSVILATEEAHA